MNYKITKAVVSFLFKRDLSVIDGAVLVSIALYQPELGEFLLAAVVYSLIYSPIAYFIEKKFGVNK